LPQPTDKLVMQEIAPKQIPTEMATARRPACFCTHVRAMQRSRGGHHAFEFIVVIRCGPTQGGSDGSDPLTDLIADREGALYGTTQNGGGSGCNGLGCGTVFQLTPARDKTTGKTTWTESVLYIFQGGSDGSYPYAGLIADSEGALYGTTAFSGSIGNGAGTVFQLTPARNQTTWTESVLYIFQGGSDGSLPLARLIADKEGALYGTTLNGGSEHNRTSQSNHAAIIGRLPSFAALREYPRLRIACAKEPRMKNLIMVAVLAVAFTAVCLWFLLWENHVPDSEIIGGSIRRVMVGMLFIFIIMLMAFALNLREQEHKFVQTTTTLTNANETRRTPPSCAFCERLRAVAGPTPKQSSVSCMKRNVASLEISPGWRSRGAPERRPLRAGTLLAFALVAANEHGVARLLRHGATGRSHGLGGDRRLDRQWRRSTHALPLPHRRREYALSLDLLVQ
jgi:hypothetical protein